LVMGDGQSRCHIAHVGKAIPKPTSVQFQYSAGC